MAHVIHRFLMTKPAGFGGHPQVAGIDKLDEFRRFAVEQNVGITGVGRTDPEFGMEGRNVGLAHGQAGRGIAAMAIGAAENDILAQVHARILDAGVTLQAARAFVHRVLRRLVNPIGRRQGARRGRQIARHGNRRPKTVVLRKRKRELKPRLRQQEKRGRNEFPVRTGPECVWRLYRRRPKLGGTVSML